MKNWNEVDEKGYCSSDKELEDAKFVANKLQIELREINFVKEYWINIFSRFMKEYEEGLTPNPDILCNRIIKFDLFLKYAFDTLKCDGKMSFHN
jgi:tRNA-specific 2-thiouridylase